MFGGAGDREPLLLAGGRAVAGGRAAAARARRRRLLSLSAHPLDEYRAGAAEDARPDLGGVRRVRSQRRHRRPPRRHRHRRAGAPHPHRQPDGGRPALRSRPARTRPCSSPRASANIATCSSPGKSVVVLVSAEERPEGINVRIQSVESLDRVMAGPEADPRLPPRRGAAAERREASGQQRGRAR